jgi:nicotinate-nucleotide adenylyltransferase
MTRLAVINNPLLDVLDLEGRRPGFSYSIQTLKELDVLLGGEIYFIVGSDAFYDLTTWKEYRSLFDYAHFVVIQRPGFCVNNLDELISGIDIIFERDNVSDTILQAPSGKTLILFSTTLMDISSTIIRKKVASGKSIRFLVSDNVRDYIIIKRLYDSD